MKNLIYLSFAIILNACVDQGSSNIEFTLFNKTNKSVKVLGFDRDFDNPDNSEKATPIVIEPNSKFKVTRVTGIDNDTGYRFYSIQGVDSVRVVFDNQKVKIFSRIPPNPCNICDGDENHQYFITEQDYESAEDCNGNCE